MRLPRARFTVRWMMVVIAALAVLLFAVNRCGTAIVLANYHSNHESYHRDRLAWFLGHKSEGRPNRERWSRSVDYHWVQATYHSYWRRAFHRATFRPWEGLPVPSNESPPWRSLSDSARLTDATKSH